MKTNIVDIFCMVDDFSKLFDQTIKEKSIEKEGKKRRNRKSRMSDGEVMTILVLFHLSRYRDLKAFYLQYIAHSCRSEFPHLVSYNRFVELQSKVGYKLIAFLNMCCLGECTGISFIDSTPLRACHVKRAQGHKTMKGLAQKGKCTMGWFYGFKLHIVINDKGEIIKYQITPGNCDDREPLKDSAFTKKLFGKLIGDRGYISQSLFDQLFVDDIHMITRIKKNMKNSIMHLYDKVLLRKRALIETVNDMLKNVCQIEHTRHRSVNNFLTNLISGLIAYNFLPKKPELNIEIVRKPKLLTCA
ncbi:IS982 family transposase [Porphyromonas circumdentaria]|uniref:IS982 family transposase n=1 Tax=Porphyromonas circumdentaria TaxID=29524 RepID=UPI0026DB0C90|nr:IS982 family transposase [Porphyromonas circumdentaria]MDO4722366.1 IS982 family transposase [Porphyromonas circumdentaria]